MCLNRRSPIGYCYTCNSTTNTVQALSFFDKNGNISVWTDASDAGTGGILCCIDQPVLCASRKLSLVETRYSQIKKEFLAIVFSLFRFKTFLLGMPFTVYTDNKPLISFFKRWIDDMPLQIQRWMLRLQLFTFSLWHISSHDNRLANFYSCYPLDNVAASEAETLQDIVCQVNHSLAPITLQVIKNLGIDDPLIQPLLSNISSCWPNSSSTLFAFCHQLTVDNSIVFFNSHILLLQVLCSKVMGHMLRHDT